MWFCAMRVALRALRVNVLRTVLTMLGIIIGIAAVLVMLAIGAGAQAAVEEQLRSLGTNLLVVNPGSLTAGGARLGAGSRPTLSEDDATAIQSELGDVQSAAAVLGDTGQIMSGGVNWAT